MKLTVVFILAALGFAVALGLFLRAEAPGAAGQAGGWCSCTARTAPEDSVLDRPDLYEDFEANQEKKLYRAFVVAAREKEAWLHDEIENARQASLSLYPCPSNCHGMHESRARESVPG